MEEIVNKYTSKTFEDIKHIDENGNEFWYARELQKALEYKANPSKEIVALGQTFAKSCINCGCKKYG